MTDQTAKARDFVCKICKEGFSNRHLMQIHIVLHKTPFKCKVCGLAYSDATQLKEHTAEHDSHHVPPWRCVNCKRNYKSQTNYDEHIRRSLCNVAPEGCDICGETFASKVASRNHRTHHTLEYPFHCELCFKVFECERLCKKHAKSHDVTNRCTVCGKMCATRGDLTQHLLLIHKTTEKRFLCDDCGRVFKTGYHLKNHVKTHASYSCELCGLSMQSSTFGNHMRYVHSVFKTDQSVKPQMTQLKLECKQCHKTYANIKKLRTHIRHYHGEKVHNCHLCNKVFAAKHLLNHHVKVHSPSFPCQICGKTYSSRPILKTHQIVHSKDRPFSCEICQRTFKYKFVHRDHMKKLHPDFIRSQSTVEQVHVQPTVSVVTSVIDNLTVTPQRKDATTVKRLEMNDTSSVLDASASSDSFQRCDSSQNVPVHYSSDIYECGLCAETFTDTETLTRHVSNHDIPNSAKCINTDGDNTCINRVGGDAIDISAEKPIDLHGVTSSRGTNHASAGGIEPPSGQRVCHG